MRETISPCRRSCSAGFTPRAEKTAFSWRGARTKYGSGTTPNSRSFLKGGDMLKELLKIVAAGLGSAAVQIANLIMNSQPVTSRIIVSILVGTVLVRIAMWVVAR